MKNLRMLALWGLLCLPAAWAQSDFPGNPMVTPKKFKTRSVGGGVDTGATVDPGKPEQAPVRYVTHIVLYESRFWTSADGRPLEAKLIAFEDLVAAGTKGGTEPAMPAPPPHPTVVKAGKVRLLVNKNPVEIALDKLSVQDREFVEGIRAALGKKAAEGR